MYNNISLCFILLFGGSMIRSVDPQHTTKELAIMKAFMDKDFLLETPTAQHLYHDYAETLPIVDYHCHIPPQEIYEDRRFENIAQVWLGGHQVLADGSDYYFGDHYKWRVMRSNGVPEEYITGVTSRTASSSRSLQKHWKWPSTTRCTPGATWN